MRSLALKKPNDMRYGVGVEMELQTATCTLMLQKRLCW